VRSYAGASHEYASGPKLQESKDTAASAGRVAQQTRRGISWNLAGAVATNSIRVVVIAILGRALSADDFGIVAAAVSVNVILHGIRDIGVGQALIQRKQLGPAHLTTAFAVSTYLGLAFTVLLFLAAPLIGRLYGITASVDVLRALGVLFVLRGVSTVSRMVCQREMKFRAIAIVDAVSFALGAIASIVCALSGMGPWALVIGYLVEDALSTVLYLQLSRPTVSLRIDRGALRELMSFGAGQTVSQITGIFATYGDNFVVGNALGAAALGFYTRAYELVKFPSTVFATIVGNVMFPALSRLQDDRPRLAATLRRVTFVNALVLLPASAVIIVLAPEAIDLLVGDGWDAAVVPFQILALTMLLRTNQKLSAIVAQAAGAVNGVAIAYTVYMVLVIGGAAFTIQWGIAGVAASTAVAIAVVSIESAYLAMRVSGLSLAALLGAHVPGLVLAALVVAFAWPMTHALRAAEVASPIVLIVVAASAIVLCLVVVGLWLRRGRGDFTWLRAELGRFRRRRPADVAV
jgi:O-antigen/teichoic acid export membrane protein